MRALLLPLALLFSATAAHAAPKPPENPDGYRVMLVGNSLTYANNLPALLRAVGAAEGKAISTETFAAPGGTLSERVADGAVTRTSCTLTHRLVASFCCQHTCIGLLRSRLWPLSNLRFFGPVPLWLELASCPRESVGVRNMTSFSPKRTLGLTRSGLSLLSPGSATKRAQKSARGSGGQNCLETL